MRKDRILYPNERGEFSLPIGHFTVIKGKSNEKNKKNILIYGLGSCVSLILIDKSNKIYSMNHILLPSSENRNLTIPLQYPHKYANLAVNDLIEETLNEGANKESLQAIIIGGSKIFQNHHNNIGQENLDKVRRELNKQGIKIVKEDVGGNSGRNIIFNIEDISVLVKNTREKNYRRIF